ncbi:hypothetical protein SAMN05216474_2655 [Lishizhenia tianjinensis]|uniref:Uncharacterized protein n=1 Tax=Lishizhenia tianjinensis TaxID=477690 RepID=A0A1I7BBK8_9FLAO|nr:hypothetical protein [Lishizhenia tianjinensis]SFT84583.1 hypothetical protein SAMN05216474_2655 [Lishizhenia tianjinensis]
MQRTKHIWNKFIFPFVLLGYYFYFFYLLYSLISSEEFNFTPVFGLLLFLSILYVFSMRYVEKNSLYISRKQKSRLNYSVLFLPLLVLYVYHSIDPLALHTWYILIIPVVVDLIINQIKHNNKA